MADTSAVSCSSVRIVSRYSPASGGGATISAMGSASAAAITGVGRGVGDSVGVGVSVGATVFVGVGVPGVGV